MSHYDKTDFFDNDGAVPIHVDGDRAVADSCKFFGIQRFSESRWISYVNCEFIGCHRLPPLDRLLNCRVTVAPDGFFSRNEA